MTTVLLCLFLCYLAYLGQIAIHNCVHSSMFSRRETNRVVGTILGSLLLVGFEGWRAAHMLHHGFCNKERDPHRVDRPLIPYLLTHYIRITRAVWSPKRHAMAVAPPIALAAGVIAWQTSKGHAARGALWVAALWLIPVIASHVLVAHFNYITHAGLPPGRGRDTRDFTGGVWTLINRLTFGFYRHAQHHRHPSAAIPPEVTGTRARRGDD